MSIELTHFLQDYFFLSATGIPVADRNTYKEKLQKQRYTSTGDGANLSDLENQVKNYLAHLALNRKVAAPTQNLAFNALLTFFRLAFNKELANMKHQVRAKVGKRLLAGVDIRQIQEYLGHSRVETTMIYTHVIKEMRAPVLSPLDSIRR